MGVVVYLAGMSRSPARSLRSSPEKTFQPTRSPALTEEVHKTRRPANDLVGVHSVNVDGKKLLCVMGTEGKSIDALLVRVWRGMPLTQAWQIIEEAGAPRLRARP